MNESTLTWSKDEPADELLSREWLVTNGLGGYASGTVTGACTRRFHGLLVAALPAPHGRTLMLNHLGEELSLDGRTHALAGEEGPGGDVRLPQTFDRCTFRLELGLPVWRYDLGPVVLEKRVMLPHLQNSAVVTYRIVASPGPVDLLLRPSVHFRPHEGSLGAPMPDPYKVHNCGSQFELEGPANLPRLKLQLFAPSWECLLDGGRFREVFYRVEHARGYDSQGLLWSPGAFRARLRHGEEASLLVSVEPWDTLRAMRPHELFDAEAARRTRLLAAADPGARSGFGAELVLAADQYLISPTSRSADAARSRAAGDEPRTVIAGYHWFTDWGRDTMISLEGLTSCTGRTVEAAYVLRTFARYVRDGLIPNMFPEGEHEGLYHTADATMWFFHAVHRYLRRTGDRATLLQLLPILRDILAWHERGTGFGIGVDPNDGLLRQGAQGYQLTWMDAKVEGWVVTPRRGKAVEINALYYNALRLTEGWVRDAEGDRAAAPYAAAADRARDSFNRRFWCEDGGYLFDVVDGEDGGNDRALRPNQIFAVSLDHPVLDERRWETVVEAVRKELLTPVGLRSLSRGHSDYKARYDGDLRARDAAYHQGTVWGWLAGPFVDAWLRVHPTDRAGARRFLEGFESHLHREACIGSISEIFDAEAPFTPRGCVAQAWSIAEVLRAWLRTAEPAADGRAA